VVDPALSAEPAVGQTNIAFEDIENTAVVNKLLLQFVFFSHSASAFPFLQRIVFEEHRRVACEFRPAALRFSWFS
jgi:hypothetical protein